MVAVLLALCVACSGSGNGGSHAGRPTTSGTAGAGGPRRVRRARHHRRSPTPPVRWPRRVRSQLHRLHGQVRRHQRAPAVHRHARRTARVLKFHRHRALPRRRHAHGRESAPSHVRRPGRDGVRDQTRRARPRPNGGSSAAVKIIFRDLKVRGANPNGGTSKGAYVRKLETQHGFKFEGVQGAELDHVEVTDVYGDFVYISRDTRRRSRRRNIWIHDSTFRRNGRQGIAVVAANNVIIEHNTLRPHPSLDDRPRAERAQLARVERVRAQQLGRQGPLVVRRVARSGAGQQRRDLGQPVARSRSHDRCDGARETAPFQLGVDDNMSDTTVHHRPMRFFGIDGLVVNGNTQLVSSKEPGVVMTDDCGTHVSRQRVRFRRRSPGRRDAAPPRSRFRRCPRSSTAAKRRPRRPPHRPRRPRRRRPVRPLARLRADARPAGGNGLAGWFVLAARRASCSPWPY